MTTDIDMLQVITKSWGWVGIEPRAIVGENDFGNLMIKDVQGHYWRLCPEDGHCKVVARDRQTLEQLSKDQDFLQDWSMVNLVNAAREKLGELPPGRKYYFVIPSVLGGEYAAENMQTATLHEVIGISGDIARQIRDLPDGSKIRLEASPAKQEE